MLEECSFFVVILNRESLGVGGGRGADPHPLYTGDWSQVKAALAAQPRVSGFPHWLFQLRVTGRLFPSSVVRGPAEASLCLALSLHSRPRVGWARVLGREGLAGLGTFAVLLCLCFWKAETFPPKSAVTVNPNVRCR